MSYIPTSGFTRSMVACAIASLSFAAMAQDSDQAVNDADTIVVTATRFAEPKSDAPTKIDVITRKEIEQSGAFDVPEVLQTVGGLNVVQQGGAQFGLDSVVDMGGFGAGTAAANTTVLVNGMRMNPIDLSNVPWASIPISSVDRIEVQYGGSPVIYGGGAVGGVINIITQDNNQKINQASLTAGSFGTEIFSARSADTVGNTRYDVMLSGQNSDGWRANSSTSIGNASLRLTQDLGSGDKVFAEGSMFSSFNGMPGYLLGKVGSGTPQNSFFPFDTVQNNGSRVLTGISQGLADIARFEAEFTYNNQNSTFNGFNYDTTYGDPYGARSYTNGINKWNLDFTPRVKFDLGAFGKTIVGFDYQQAAQSSTYIDALYGYNSASTARVINRSFYLSQNTDLLSNLGLSLGVRRQTQQTTLNDSSVPLSSPSADNSATGAEAGLNYKYAEGQRAYLRYVRSFRFPTTDEFWASGYDSNYQYVRFLNGIIKPQTGNEVDLGGEWTLGNHKPSAMLYALKTNNEIQLVPITGTLGYNLNLPSVNHQGIKLADRWLATDHLLLNASVTYQTQKMTSGTASTMDGQTVSFSSGANMSGVPNWLANINGNYKITAAASVGMLMNYVGPQYYTGDIQNQYPKMPGYFLGDIYGQYKFTDSTVKLTVKNFTNTNYSSFAGISSYSSKFFYYPSNPLGVYLSYSINFK